MVFDRLLRDIDGGKVLDVGCGTGQFIEILDDSLKSIDSVTGVDVAEEFLSEAREKFRDSRYSFLLADSARLPFEDGSFDMAVISKALHHVEDPAATLGEMKRVLKTGGYLLINEMHRNALTDAQESHMLYHHLRSEIDNALGISHNHTFLREDLLRFGNSLELEDRVIMEFSPDDGLANDPGNVSEFIDKMDGWLENLDGHPEREKFAARIGELKNTFRSQGITRPPQLVILGRKS